MAGMKPIALPHMKSIKKCTNIWDLCVGYFGDSKDYKLNSKKQEWKCYGLYFGILSLLLLLVKKLVKNDGIETWDCC